MDDSMPEGISESGSDESVLVRAWVGAGPRDAIWAPRRKADAIPNGRDKRAASRVFIFITILKQVEKRGKDENGYCCRT